MAFRRPPPVGASVNENVENILYHQQLPKKRKGTSRSRSRSRSRSPKHARSRSRSVHLDAPSAQVNTPYIPIQAQNDFDKPEYNFYLIYSESYNEDDVYDKDIDPEIIGKQLRKGRIIHDIVIPQNPLLIGALKDDKIVQIEDIDNPKIKYVYTVLKDMPDENSITMANVTLDPERIDILPPRPQPIRRGGKRKTRKRHSKKRKSTRRHRRHRRY